MLATGYADGVVAIQLDRGITGYRELFLASVSATATFDPSTGGYVQFADEIRVYIDPGSVVSVAGTVSGMVQADIAVLHPGTDEIFAAPGELTEDAPAARPIESGYLFNLALRQGTERVYIDPRRGFEFRVVFPSWPAPLALTDLSSSARWEPSAGLAVRYELYATPVSGEVFDGITDADGWVQLGQTRAVAGCVRGCVVDGGGPVAGASVWMRGSRNFVGYTATRRDGCFVASVADDTYAIAAASTSGVSVTRSISGATGMASTPSTCLDIGDITLVPRTAGTGGCGSGCGLSGSTCSGACTDLRTDARSCGTCGMRCTDGQTCVDGACACTTAGRATCTVSGRATCVDTQTDRSHCGMCGNACATGQECLLGSCQAILCNLTYVAQCGNVCVNTEEDPRHCGGCSMTCRSDQTCSSSACVCPAGRTDCAGACRDLSSDASHCGMCGMSCRADQTCAGGRCACPSGRTECGGACVDLSSDRNHCGSCTRSCTLPFCRAGMCSVVP